MGVMLDPNLEPTSRKDKRKAEVALMLAIYTFRKIGGLKPTMIYWLYTMVVEPMITYAFFVWWPKMKQAITVN